MFNKLKALLSTAHISTKFLLFIASVSFLIICFSIFDSNLDASNNLATLRTVFSSVVGFMLEISTRDISCKDETMMLRNYFVGVVASLITITLIISVIFNTEMNNPSILLLKNSLFSCIGFLISCSKDCDSVDD